MTLIDEWRDCLKHAWSLRLTALGFLVQAISYINDLGLLNIWNMMPFGVRQIMPAHADHIISGVLFGAAFVARFIPQKKLADLRPADQTTGVQADG